MIFLRASPEGETRRKQGIGLHKELGHIMFRSGRLDGFLGIRHGDESGRNGRYKPVAGIEVNDWALN